MKNDYALLKLCWLVSLVMLFAFPLACFSQKNLPKTFPTSSDSAGNLQISLATDKATYSIGDEIHFEVVFTNRGKKPFRVLVHRTLEVTLECTDETGARCACKAGYGYQKLLLKPGAFLGKALLLKPGEKKTVRMDALIDGKYQLIFGNMSDKKIITDYQKVKEEKNLPADFPDKYISDGKIYPLLKPGVHRFTYVYETAEADKHWWSFTDARTSEEASVDLLWIGKVTSNAVEIRF